MKTDSELEALLRTTLANRAMTVTQAPPVPAGLPSRRPPWLPLLAAAAAVALAVAGVLLGVHFGRSKPPAAPPVPADLLRSCTIPLPAAWRSASQHGDSAYGAVSAFPIGASTDGRQTLVARDFGAARDVALVDASGKARSIYQVPQPNRNQVQHASIAGAFAVIDLQRLPRNANGVIGTDLAVVLVNVRTGATETLAAVSAQDIKDGGRTIDGSLIRDDQVYWDYRRSYADPAGVVQDYDLATGRTAEVYRGDVGAPTATPFGISVSWGGQGHLIVARPVPQPVLEALPRHTGQAAPMSDGSSYAWVVGRRIVWWGPGHNRVNEIRFPPHVRPGLAGVAGPYVFFVDTNSLSPISALRVLDARSGAVATVPGLQPYGLANNGVFVGYRFQSEFKDSATRSVRIDTTALPPLTC